jgi:hypothetical protein
MHNWWLATLEHAGLLTREEAQKIADQIKIRIHKEVYSEAYREIENIVGADSPLKALSDLKSQVKILEAKISELTNKPDTKESKVIIGGSPAYEPKPVSAQPKKKSVAQIKT